MTAISDTHRLVERWREAGIPAAQAGKMVEALNAELAPENSRFATKADIAELRAEMYKALALQAVAIVGLTVALLKVL